MIQPANLNVVMEYVVILKTRVIVHRIAAVRTNLYVVMEYAVILKIRETVHRIASRE